MTKGLVSLKKLENNLRVFYLNNEEDEEQVKFIAQSLCVIEKELKALEIIEQTNPIVDVLYEKYYLFIGGHDGITLRLTVEQYNLLKEVLKDE